MFIQSQQLRPPSTPLIKREHTVPTLPSDQGDSGMSCPSFKESASASPLMRPPLEVDSDDEEYLPTDDLDDTVWSNEHVPNIWEYLCIHQIPRPATPQPQSSEEAPGTRTYGYRDSRGTTRHY